MRRYRIWLTLLFATGAFLRFYRLTAQSLWYDEGWSITLSGGASWAGTAGRIFGLSGSERYQPGYFFLLHLWRSAFGESEFSLRALSALCGVVAAILLSVVAARLYGRREAFLCALFASISAFAVSMSQEVRPYALLMALAAAQTLWVVDAWRSGRRSWPRALALALLSALAAFCSALLALYAVALCLADLALSSRRAVVFRFWLPAGAAVATLCLTALALLPPAPPGSISLASRPLLLNALFVPFSLLFGAAAGPPLNELRGAGAIAATFRYWPALLGAIFSVAVLAEGFRQLLPRISEQRRRALLFPLMTLVVGYGLAFAFAAATHLNWQPRHSCFLAAPALLLVSALAADAVRTHAVRQWPLAGGVLLFAAINLFALFNYYYDSRRWRDDYRAVAALLGDAFPRTPRFLLWGHLDLLRYYGDRSTVDARAMRKARLATDLADAAPRASRLVLLINRPFYWGSERELRSALAPRYDITGRWRFSNFVVCEVRLVPR